MQSITATSEVPFTSNFNQTAISSATGYKKNQHRLFFSSFTIFRRSPRRISFPIKSSLSVRNEDFRKREPPNQLKNGVVIVDHGSRRQESNLMLNDFVAMFKSRTGYQIVEPAHMMDLQNIPITVQLGHGASIQLANTVINTGNFGATIQFGSLNFPEVVAKVVVVPAYDTDTKRLARRPHSTEISASRAHLSAPRTTAAAKNPRKRTSVFERLSQPEAPATKRIVAGGRIFVVTANTVILPTRLSTPRKYDAEASSSGGRLTRRQRRKKNAELRSQQLLPIHPSNMPAQEPEATIPTQNGFTNLKWVKRNSSTAEAGAEFLELTKGFYQAYLSIDSFYPKDEFD